MFLQISASIGKAFVASNLVMRKYSTRVSQTEINASAQLMCTEIDLCLIVLVEVVIEDVDGAVGEHPGIVHRYMRHYLYLRVY